MNPVEFYDQFADRYDQWYSGPGVKREDRAWLGVLRELGPVVDRGHVVDVGCGTGALLDYLKDGDRYLGIDAAPRMVNEAERKHPEAKFMVADMDRRINLGRRFDLAVCNFSFNYFSDPKQALWNLFRMLKPDGRLFLTLMRPKQVMMKSCSHRFDYSLVHFYDKGYFNNGLFSVVGSCRFGVTSAYVNAKQEDAMIAKFPWLANFEVVVCART